MYFPLIDIHVECTLYLNLDIKKLVGQFSQNADEEPADNENGMSSFIFNVQKSASFSIHCQLHKSGCLSLLSLTLGLQV
jgi:hypothetical protein